VEMVDGKKSNNTTSIRLQFSLVSPNITGLHRNICRKVYVSLQLAKEKGKNQISPSWIVNDTQSAL
jgi:hypothetical protein